MTLPDDLNQETGLDMDEIDILSIESDLKEDDNSELKNESLTVPIATSNPLYLTIKENGTDVTPEQLKVLDKFISEVEFGHHKALAMKCKATCAFLEICPLNQAKIPLPINKPCSVERAVMATWASKLVTALDINPAAPEDAVDMNMIYELSAMEMLRYRAAWELSTNPTLVEERVVGYSPQGDPIYAEQPRMALLILEKYAKVIGKIRDQLLATRRSQAQVGRQSADISIRAANMLEKARKLAESRRESYNSAENVDFEIKE